MLRASRGSAPNRLSRTWRSLHCHLHLHPMYTPYDELFIETTVWLSTTTVLSGSITASLPALHFFLSRPTSGSVNVKNRLNVFNLLFGTISSFGGKSEDRECGRGREGRTFRSLIPLGLRGVEIKPVPKRKESLVFPHPRTVQYYHTL